MELFWIVNAYKMLDVWLDSKYVSDNIRILKKINMQVVN